MLSNNRRLVVLTFVLVMVLASSTFAAKKYEGVTLNIMRPTEKTDVMVRVDQLFEELTGAKINAVEGPNSSDRYTQIVTALASGQYVYDLVDMDTPWTARFVTADWITPVEEYIPDDYKEKISEISWLGATYDGQIWGVPYLSSSGKELFYNERIFREAGMQEPAATWDELVDQSLKIQGAGLVEYATIWSWIQKEALTCDFVIINGSFGGKIFEDGKAVLNRPESVRALQFMVDSIYKYGISDPASITSDENVVNNAFLNESIAYKINWGAGTGTLIQQSPIRANFKVGLIPGHNKGISATTAGAHALAITKTSPNKKAAIDYALLVGSEEVQKMFALEGRIPTWTTLYDLPEIREKIPYMEEFGIQLKYANVRPRLTWYSEFSAALQEEVQNALIQRKSPQKALDDLVTTLDRLIHRYGDVDG